MDTQDVTRTIDSYYEHFNDGDLDGVISHFSDDYVGHWGLGGGGGIELVRKQLGMWYRAVPDLQAEITQTVVSDDWVATFQVLRGTQTGDLGGWPASGKKFRLGAVDMFRVRDGRIVEGRTICDTGPLIVAAEPATQV